MIKNYILVFSAVFRFSVNLAYLNILGIPRLQYISMCQLDKAYSNFECPGCAERSWSKQLASFVLWLIRHSS